MSAHSVSRQLDGCVEVASDNELLKALAEAADLGSRCSTATWNEVLGPAILSSAYRGAASVTERTSERDGVVGAAVEALYLAVRTCDPKKTNDPASWMYRIARRAASRELQLEAHRGVTGLRDAETHRPSWRTRPAWDSSEPAKRFT